MKYMIASDLHGDAECTRALLDRFDESDACRLLLLGDLLYHGPRNDLPAGYAPKDAKPCSTIHSYIRQSLSDGSWRISINRKTAFSCLEV